MSSNGAGFTTPPSPVAGRRRGQVSRWVIRVVVAFVICVLVILFFFTSDAISH